jgi:palmitoyl-protein thioesterase
MVLIFKNSDSRLFHLVRNGSEAGMGRIVLLLLVVLTVFSGSIYAKTYRPVVLMHGVTATASDLYEFAGWINQTFPGIYVVSIEIGNGHDDSFMLPMNRQVEMFCATVRGDPHLQQGFNMLGFSQGSVIARAAVERCSLPVYNLITLSGVNQGVFGVPNLLKLPPPFRELISEFAYEDAVQNVVSIAGYWRDPYHLEKYITHCRFLPDINNELPVQNQTYKMNMLKLNAFVMTYSDVDETVAPGSSGWFLGYKPKSLEIEAWNETRQFTEDLIGLRTLWEQGKIHRFTTHVPHGESDHTPNKDFIFQNIMPFFNNTLPEL